MRVLIASLIMCNMLLGVAIVQMKQPAPIQLGCAHAPKWKGKWYV